jgi:hypothetical protein
MSAFLRKAPGRAHSRSACYMKTEVQQNPVSPYVLPGTAIVQFGSGAHPVSCVMRTVSSSRDGKAARA